MLVTTTEDHPFWNATDGTWRGPEEFDAGDRVLTVQGIDTFYVVVANEAVLVHNCPGKPLGFDPPTPTGATMKSPAQIADALGGYTARDVRAAIEEIKTEWGRMGGSGRNPDVVVDRAGEVFPVGPNGLGDSIGNLRDYLPGAG